MTIKEINKYARSKGCDVSKIKRKADKIRAIQTTEGNDGCFGAEWAARCGQTDCLWREDCIVTE